ncbi:MAG: polyprenyl synthetase family protein, partial [Mesorhizobium sp.]
MTNDDQMAFEMALIRRAAAVEVLLRRLLDDRALSGEIARPER